METCEKCGQEKPDALRRDGRDIPMTQKKEPNPIMCAECVSAFTGREWMKPK